MSNPACRRKRITVCLRLVMRELIRFVSSAGTGYTYYSSKNKRTTPDKLKLMKYDPKARKHVEFTEAKMPNPKK